MDRCHFIPPFLLSRLAEASPDARGPLRTDVALRARRAVVTALPPRATSSAPFSVYTADGGTDLPGQLVRAAGAPAAGDDAVDEAYSGVEASLALYREVFGRDSFDDKGAPVLATVHYDRDYDNAFWDGTQLVFGDGDGRVFDRFTKPIDVLGHELSHAVTQFTADLTYQGQSGALNESMSDVFGACIKQRHLGQ